MPFEPDGYTIFCDDIRQEVGNKTSLMGVYGPEMFVNQPFPAAMHRMGFHIMYREDPHAPMEDITLPDYPDISSQERTAAIERWGAGAVWAATRARRSTFLSRSKRRLKRHS